MFSGDKYLRVYNLMSLQTILLLTESCLANITKIKEIMRLCLKREIRSKAKQDETIIAAYL